MPMPPGKSRHCAAGRHAAYGGLRWPSGPPCNMRASPAEPALAPFWIARSRYADPTRPSYLTSVPKVQFVFITGEGNGPASHVPRQYAYDQMHRNKKQHLYIYIYHVASAGCTSQAVQRPAEPAKPIDILFRPAAPAKHYSDRLNQPNSKTEQKNK